MLKKSDNKTEIEAWLLENKIKKLKPGKAKYASPPGFSCLNHYGYGKSQKELDEMKAASEAWNAKRREWKRKNKLKIKEWKAKRRKGLVKNGPV